MLNMLLHSVFQGVQIGQVPEAILSFKWENTLISRELLPKECNLPSWECGRQDQIPAIDFSHKLWPW